LSYDARIYLPTTSPQPSLTLHSHLIQVLCST
jgi:hypothetical protein